VGRSVRSGARRRRGLRLSAISLKIGSDLRVKVHQRVQKIGIVARTRRFFFGRAQREPRVFQGGNGKLPRYK